MSANEKSAVTVVSIEFKTPLLIVNPGTSELPNDKLMALLSKVLFKVPYILK